MYPKAIYAYTLSRKQFTRFVRKVFGRGILPARNFWLFVSLLATGHSWQLGFLTTLLLQATDHTCGNTLDHNILSILYILFLHRFEFLRTGCSFLWIVVRMSWVEWPLPTQQVVARLFFGRPSFLFWCLPPSNPSFLYHQPTHIRHKLRLTLYQPGPHSWPESTTTMSGSAYNPKTLSLVCVAFPPTRELNSRTGTVKDGNSL